MANAPQIVQMTADYSVDRGGQHVIAIVAHGTGGGLKSSLETLQHGDGRGVSIHALIAKNGTIYRMVPDERGANHAGAPTSSFTLHGGTYRAGGVNRATLGFELDNMQDGRDPYTDLQLLAMGWLIATWRAKYGPIPILRHADLDPTRRRDPYKLSTDDMEIWTKRVMETIPPVATLSKKYRFPGLPIFQSSSLSGSIFGYLTPSEVVTIDARAPLPGYAANAAHIIRADGSAPGFVDERLLLEVK